MEAALVVDPHDLVALRVAQDLYFFLGDGRSCASAPPGCCRLARRPPGWGFVQGMYAFGLEEYGDYRGAEAAARAALDADPPRVGRPHAGPRVRDGGRPRGGMPFLSGRRRRLGPELLRRPQLVAPRPVPVERRVDDALALYDDRLRGRDSTSGSTSSTRPRCCGGCHSTGRRDLPRRRPSRTTSAPGRRPRLPLQRLARRHGLRPGRATMTWPRRPRRRRAALPAPTGGPSNEPGGRLTASPRSPPGTTPRRRRPCSASAPGKRSAAATPSVTSST